MLKKMSENPARESAQAGIRTHIQLQKEHASTTWAMVMVYCFYNFIFFLIL